MALAAALASPPPWPWCLLAAGTDGQVVQPYSAATCSPRQDGPTGAAGGFADDSSRSRASALGVDLAARLADNDAARALAALGDQLVTGLTGTNVMDLYLLAVTPN